MEAAAAELRKYLETNGPQLLPDFYERDNNRNRTQRQIFDSILEEDPKIQIDHPAKLVYPCDVESKVIRNALNHRSSTESTRSLSSITNTLLLPDKSITYPYLKGKDEPQIKEILIEHTCRKRGMFVWGDEHFIRDQNPPNMKFYKLMIKIRQYLAKGCKSFVAWQNIDFQHLETFIRYCQLLNPYGGLPVNLLDKLQVIQGERSVAFLHLKDQKVIKYLKNALPPNIKALDDTSIPCLHIFLQNIAPCEEIPGPTLKELRVVFKRYPQFFSEDFQWNQQSSRGMFKFNYDQFGNLTYPSAAVKETSVKLAAQYIVDTLRNEPNGTSPLAEVSSRLCDKASVQIAMLQLSTADDVREFVKENCASKVRVDGEIATLKRNDEWDALCRRKIETVEELSRASAEISVNATEPLVIEFGREENPHEREEQHWEEIDRKKRTKPRTLNVNQGAKRPTTKKVYHTQRNNHFNHPSNLWRRRTSNPHAMGSPNASTTTSTKRRNSNNQRPSRRETLGPSRNGTPPKSTDSNASVQKRSQASTYNRTFAANSKVAVTTVKKPAQAPDVFPDYVSPVPRATSNRKTSKLSLVSLNSSTRTATPTSSSKGNPQNPAWGGVRKWDTSAIHTNGSAFENQFPAANLKPGKPGSIVPGFSTAPPVRVPTPSSNNVYSHFPTPQSNFSSLNQPRPSIPTMTSSFPPSTGGPVLGPPPNFHNMNFPTSVPPPKFRNMNFPTSVPPPNFHNINLPIFVPPPNVPKAINVRVSTPLINPMYIPAAVPPPAVVVPGPRYIYPPTATQTYRKPPTPSATVSQPSLAAPSHAAANIVPTDVVAPITRGNQIIDSKREPEADLQSDIPVKTDKTDDRDVEADVLPSDPAVADAQADDLAKQRKSILISAFNGKQLHVNILYLRTKKEKMTNFTSVQALQSYLDQNDSFSVNDCWVRRVSVN